MALERLYGAREGLPPGSFYNAALSTHIDLVREYTQFVSSQAVFSWLRYPYLLTAQAKANLVAIAFKSEMERAFLQQRVQQAGYTILTIRRDHLVEDAFTQLHALSGPELQRPLKVIFAGELGVDEGGLTKELLYTILEKLLDPDYGMFTFNQLSGKNWINRMASASAPTVHYELVGMVVGLAVANGVILNVNFPPLLYR
jgi:ubiquitin-protein ligase E3 A